MINVASFICCHYNSGCLSLPYCWRVLHLSAGYCTDAQGCEAVNLLAQNLVECWAV